MQSDILIMFKNAQNDEDLKTAKTCLMNVDRSVLVHQKEGSERVLLIKYDPNNVKPAHLIEAVRSAGFDATMAGG